MSRHRSKEEQKAIHAKRRNGISSISLKHSDEAQDKALVSKAIKKHEMQFHNDAKISRGEARDWEKAAHSQIVSAKSGTFEGKQTLDVKFKNGEDWFEFRNFKDQERFFDKNEFKKDTPVGKFISVKHPKIDGYVRMLTGRTLQKEKEDGTKKK